jgi:hypothetical protein
VIGPSHLFFALPRLINNAASLYYLSCRADYVTRLLFWAQANAAATSSHLQELAGDNVRVTATASYGNGSTQVTKIVQGWPKLWAKFKAPIGIYSQSVEPSLATWANPVQFSLVRCGLGYSHTDGIGYSASVLMEWDQGASES